MSRQPFATLVFQGARFAAAMPVQALPELAAYQELVLAAARGLFIKRNPGRKRLPGGFADSFHLFLERVEQGSAVPVLLREASPSSDALVERLGFDYFEEARQLVERAIEAANGEGTQLPSDLSDEALAKFSAFGRTLGDDEAIVVASPGTRIGARYTREVRRRIVLRVLETIEEPVNIVGEVISARTDPWFSFELRPWDIRFSKPVEVRASKPIFDKAVKAMTEGAPVVSLVGTGLFDNRNQLTRITEVSDFALAEDPTRGGCKLPIEVQVSSLEHLAPGWYDPDSPAYDPLDLSWAARLFKAVVESFDLPNPFVYPTPEGAVRAEWSSYPWELSVILDAKNRRSEVYATDLSTRDQHENSFALSETGSEARMGKFLAQHLHGR